MASWCLLRGLLRRIKYGNGLNENSSKVYARLQDGFYAAHLKENNIHAPRVVTRLFHASQSDYGKRLPSGVNKKRNPLKVKQKSDKPRVTVHRHMTIRDLADAMNRPRDDVYEILAFMPDTDDYDYDDCVLDEMTMVDVVRRAGMIPNIVNLKTKPEVKENKDVKRQPPPRPEDLVKRPPVVTIMGHVDHGKTTLLDKLRNSKIVDNEFGGITQHIGSFLVKLSSGDSICFLDTPGHAAFSAMRSRGAHVTDIIVLVVAADDGVMQQTQEVIDLSKETGVPLIVAINKIDKNNADVEHSKQTLLQHDVMLEEFGGDVQAVPISALKEINLLELQEAILTLADLMDIKGDPKGLVEGRVVEARLDAKKGRLVNAVIQRGTLKRGDVIVAGNTWCKVRAMTNDLGQQEQKVLPGNPVEILGFKETPSAGSEILQVSSEAEAKKVVQWRKEQQMLQKQDEDDEVITQKREVYNIEYQAKLESKRALGYRKLRPTGPKEKEIKDSGETELSIVLKGDVDGSVEAILGVIDTYKSDLCKLSLLNFDVGHVTESDVEMAATFNGEIYAFNVDVPTVIAELAKSKGIRIRKHNIIYRLFDNLKEDINSRLPKVPKDFDIGEAKILEVFQINLPRKRKAYVAGCRCVEGFISRKFAVKVMRDDVEVYRGNITSLKHFKEEVDNIKKEQLCGIALDDPELAFQPQDQIISYEIRDVEQYIEWNPGF